ncbi:MAG: septation protein SpoVG family protein [Candidatus Hydrothermarchaeales archaeon]
MVELSDIRIYKLKDSEKQKAFASVTLDGEFAVHGLKVMARDDGDLWVGFPSRRDASGQFRDVFHPITKEAREKIITAVLDAYNNEAED